MVTQVLGNVIFLTFYFKCMQSVYISTAWSINKIVIKTKCYAMCTCNCVKLTQSVMKLEQNYIKWLNLSNFYSIIDDLKKIFDA